MTSDFLLIQKNYVRESAVRNTAEQCADIAVRSSRSGYDYDIFCSFFPDTPDLRVPDCH